MAERQKGDSAPPTPSGDSDGTFGHSDLSGGPAKPSGTQKALYFLAEVRLLSESTS
jgi:hypothetical protein